MARDFNGSTDRIDWSSVFNPQNAALSASMWVYPDSVAGDQYFFSINTGASTGLVLWINVSTRLQFVRVGGTNKVRRSNDALSVGSWQHVLITDDGSDTAANVHIYVDGTETDYVTTQNGATQSSYGGTWSVGGRTSGDDRNFNGREAEVAVWDRVLTAGEIAALAEGYSPAFFQSGLRFYPPLIRGINDPVSGAAGVADGTTISTHPRVFQHTSSGIYVPAAIVTRRVFVTQFN